MKLFAILVLVFASTSMWAQTNTPVITRLAVSPSKIKPNGTAHVTVGLQNPRRDETLTLHATATYEVDGVQQTSEAETTLTIDRSITVSLTFNLRSLTILAETIKFDGQPLAQSSLTVTLPADGSSHSLEFDVKHSPP